MKPIFTTLFLLSFFISFSQVPQGIPYQSAMRNSSGGILANQNVSIRFSIHDSSITGNIVYQENHSATTSNLGLVSLTIGQGTATTGTFATINWAQHAKFLQVEMDPLGGASYVDLGTQQMMSVPYALSAGSLSGIGLPSITTDTIIDIHSTNAKVIINLANDGGTAFTIKGLCWSTNPVPTINDQSILIGVGAGSSIGNITGLIPNTHYYIRSFASNQSGIVYGNILNFVTTLKIGDDYQGGKVAYILKPSDTGYIVGEMHGIIAAPFDQSNGIVWGCYGISLGGTSENFATGNSNTNSICNNCSDNIMSARLCLDLEINGFGDWYLPSAQELKQLYWNRILIGSFMPSLYWSSSEDNGNSAIIIDFNNGIAGSLQNSVKYNSNSVRAVRSF